MLVSYSFLLKISLSHGLFIINIDRSDINNVYYNGFFIRPIEYLSMNHRLSSRMCKILFFIII
jgi:hypothetical protein